MDIIGIAPLQALFSGDGTNHHVEPIVIAFDGFSVECTFVAIVGDMFKFCFQCDFS